MSETEVISVRLPKESYNYLHSIAEEDDKPMSTVAAEYVEAGIKEEETRLSALAARLKDAGEKAVGFAVLVSVVMYVLGHGLEQSFVMFMSFLVLALTLMLLGELFDGVSEENGVVSGVDRGQMSDDSGIVTIAVVTVVGILVYGEFGPQALIFIGILFVVGYVVNEYRNRYNKVGEVNGE